MNILGDFITRVNNLYPADIDNDELESLLTTIKNQGDEIATKDKEIEHLQTKIKKMILAEGKPLDKKPAPKKTTVKKAAECKKTTTKKTSAKKAEKK